MKQLEDLPVVAPNEFGARGAGLDEWSPDLLVLLTYPLLTIYEGADRHKAEICHCLSPSFGADPPGKTASLLIQCVARTWQDATEHANRLTAFRLPLSIKNEDCRKIICAIDS
jgi:hypothetical protein